MSCPIFLQSQKIIIIKQVVKIVYDQVNTVVCITWILMILGNGCFVFAPPSIAMPMAARVLGMEINKLPSLFWWTSALCSFVCFRAWSRALFGWFCNCSWRCCKLCGSFLNCCLDWKWLIVEKQFHWNLIDIIDEWFELTKGRPKYHDCNRCVIDRIPSK